MLFSYSKGRDWSPTLCLKIAQHAHVDVEICPGDGAPSWNFQVFAFLCSSLEHSSVINVTSNASLLKTYERDARQKKLHNHDTV